MKKVTFYTLFLFVVTFGISACNEVKEALLKDAIAGNGQVIEAERSVGEFSKISVSEGINAFITMGEEENIKVEADENLEELIIVEVKGDWLKIYLEDNVKDYKKLDVYITADDLKAVKASSSANVMVESDIEADDFSLEASSAASLSLKNMEVLDLDGSVSSNGKIQINDLTAKSADLDASSAGDIQVNTGMIEDLDGEASSSGDLSMKVVQAAICKAKATSGGGIRVTVNKTLSASASSGGSVKYWGSPQVDKSKTSSGGSVKQQ